MSTTPCPAACTGCRDNFVLPEMHQPGALEALDMFDGPAVRGQIERRRACDLVPDPDKPCLKPPPALEGKTLADIESVADAGASEPPTVRQVERLILDFMISGIERLSTIRCDDADWNAADVDTDMAADLALLHLKRMRAGEPGDFDLNWWTAASAIHLGHKAFSRPDSTYGRMLAALARDFAALVELPAFVENRAAGG